MTQVYGYAVCLVAVITFLISTGTLVNGILDYSNPLQAGWPSDRPSLASFEIYKVDIAKSLGDNEIPDDQTLRAMYEAAKADKINNVKHRSRQSMIVSSLLILLCVVLFITHWRWMRKLVRQEA